MPNLPRLVVAAAAAASLTVALAGQPAYAAVKKSTRPVTRVVHRAAMPPRPPSLPIPRGCRASAATASIPAAVVTSTGSGGFATSFRPRTSAPDRLALQAPQYPPSPSGAGQGRGTA